MQCCLRWSNTASISTCEARRQSLLNHKCRTLNCKSDCRKLEGNWVCLFLGDPGFPFSFPSNPPKKRVPQLRHMRWHGSRGALASARMEGLDPRALRAPKFCRSDEGQCVSTPETRVRVLHWVSFGIPEGPCTAAYQSWLKLKEQQDQSGWPYLCSPLYRSVGGTFLL